MENMSDVKNMFTQFIDTLTANMKPTVRTHSFNYVMALMLPPEKKRKSIVAITELVSNVNQSTMNRAMKSIDPVQLLRNWILSLKDEIDNHPVILVIDDTLNEHPGSVVMKAIAWFHDRKIGKSVKAHQIVTTGLYDTVTERFYPFVIKLYKKKEYCKVNGQEFKTKIDLVADFLMNAYENFNVVKVVTDSWYASSDFLKNAKLFVTELKCNRVVKQSEVSVVRGKHDKTGWMSLDELANLMKENLTDRAGMNILPTYGKYLMTKVSLTNGLAVSLLILYDKKHNSYKYLISNEETITIEEYLKIWRVRWMIEEFHKDGKALGLGVYQTRDEVMPLIHGVSLIFAYTLLAKMARESQRMFGEIVKTIGECSRLLKKLSFFKKDYKSFLFTG